MMFVLTLNNQNERLNNPISKSQNCGTSTDIADDWFDDRTLSEIRKMVIHDHSVTRLIPKENMATFLGLS